MGGSSEGRLRARRLFVRNSGQVSTGRVVLGRLLLLKAILFLMAPFVAKLASDMPKVAVVPPSAVACLEVATGFLRSAASLSRVGMFI